MMAKSLRVEILGEFYVEIEKIIPPVGIIFSQTSEYSLPSIISLVIWYDDFQVEELHDILAGINSLQQTFKNKFSK